MDNVDTNKKNIGLFVIGARLLFITWPTKNTFSKRTPFLLLYSLFTIPKNYLLPAKRKVSYMSGKLSMSVLYWIFSNRLHSYCIHYKRRGMQQCHVFLNCCHVEKMTQILSQNRLYRKTSSPSSFAPPYNDANALSPATMMSSFACHISLNTLAC